MGTNIVGLGLGDRVGFENLEEGHASQRKLASLSFDAAGFGTASPSPAMPRPVPYLLG